MMYPYLYDQKVFAYPVATPVGSRGFRGVICQYPRQMDAIYHMFLCVTGKSTTHERL